MEESKATEEVGRAEVKCAHCGKEFAFPKRRRGGNEGVRPTLVKCPHCYWKFEVPPDEGQEASPPKPYPGRFNL